jgi:hypothetical protein
MTVTDNTPPGSVFSSAQVINITDKLQSGAAANSQAFKDLIDVANSVAPVLDGFGAADPMSKVSDLFDQFAPICTELHIDIDGWTLSQRITFVTMAVRLRRYAENDPLAFQALVTSVRERTRDTLTAAGDPPPPDHW